MWWTSSEHSTERMDEQDRLSQASSVVTISSFPVRPQTGEEKVQTFGKRCYAVKRDPNCPVVIRGWLYKKDSSGLKLWKRRWFVLSEYCLFYYKDSREETVLGSIPLPSYSVLFCTPRECKNRKYTFKVVHKGMRTYFFSADTQEDMLGWVRAISQSASMDTESTINKRCSSYQDFTLVDSSEFVHTHHNTSLRDVQSSKKQTDQDERAQSQVEKGGKKKAVQMSESSPREQSDECSLPFLSIPQYFPSCPQSLSSRAQLDSRPHTPVGRVDIRPHNDLPPMPPSNKQTFGAERHTHKGSVSSQLPPLPSSRLSPNLGNPHYQSLRNHSFCQHLPTLSERYDGFQGSEIHSSKTSDNHVDAVLTKLCGCDKQLQALCAELSHLQVEKESLQAALEVSHIQLDECKYTEAQMNQKAMLQDELVTIRARICDVLADMDYVWCQYERMESELAVFRSQLQHVCHYGPHQEQHKAQKQLWMMEDIVCGLRDNRNHYRLVLGLLDHPGEEIPGHNLEVEIEAPFPSPLSHDVWMSPHMCKASRCESHIYSKPYSCYQDQKQGDWNQGNRIHTWPSADPAVNVTRMSSVYKKDCRKGTREQDQTEVTKSCEETTDTHREASGPKPSALQHDPSSELQEATALPLRVTRVITATLPSALTAHRVSVQDPPLELVNALPEQIPQMLPKKAPSKPTRMSSQYTGLRLQEEEQNDMAAQRAARVTRQRNGLAGREAHLNHRGQSTPSRDQRLAQEVEGDAHPNCLSEEKRNQTSDLDLRPEQREAKLKRVERIRQRVIRSVSKENQPGYLPTTNPILQNTKDPGSQVVQNASSNIHTSSAEKSEKSLGAFQKHLKHEIHPSLSARTPSLPVQNSALSNKVDLTDKSSPSNNNRSEWFLSTCEWQGFKPLVNSGLDLSTHDTTEAELEDLSGNSTTQKNKDSAHKQLKKIHTSGAQPRSKENRIQLLNEALECQEENKGIREKLCDMASVSPVSVLMTPSANCSCDAKSSTVTKNDNNKVPDDLVVASESSDKCKTCLHQQLNLELSVYEEIPNTEFSSLTTEDREHEKQEQKKKCLDGVREDVTVDKKGCTQSETVSCKPEHSRSQIQPNSNQSVYCTIPMNGLENHTRLVWSKVTMDRTSL